MMFLKREKKKKKIKLSEVYIYINSSFGNTIISVSDIFGNVLLWSSSGSEGFKSSKKSTPFASGIVANSIIKKSMSIFEESENLKICADIYIKGPGNGSDAAIRNLSSYFKINKIANITGIPHNGCRPKKERRV